MIDDAKLRELIADLSIPVQETVEKPESYYKWHDARVTINSLAVPLAEEVLALRSMLNHAAACEVRNPAECNECKNIWLKGYPYAE